MSTLLALLVIFAFVGLFYGVLRIGEALNRRDERRLKGRYEEAPDDVDA